MSRLPIEEPESPEDALLEKIDRDRAAAAARAHALLTGPIRPHPAQRRRTTRPRSTGE